MLPRVGDTRTPMQPKRRAIAPPEATNMHKGAVRTAVASGAVAFSGLMWGLLWWPLRHLEAQGLSVGWTIAALNLLPVLGLGVFAVWHRQRQGLAVALAIGVLAGCGLALYGVSLVTTSVVRATLLFYLTPVWGTLFGMVWLGERGSAKRWLAIVTGLVGLAVLVGGKGGGAFQIGDLLAFGSGLAWAGAATLIRRNPDLPVAAMTALQFLFLTLFALALDALIGDLPPIPAGASGSLALVFSLSLLGVLPATLALFWAQQLLSPGRVGLLMMSEVLMAAVSASILLPNERLSVLQWLGAILIVGAGVVEFLPERRRRG